MKLIKKLRAQVAHSDRLSRGYDAHMSKRPKGVARHVWMQRWMDENNIAHKPVEVVQAHHEGPKIRAKARRRFASDEFLDSFEWRQLRMVVIKKRGRRCECCGATPADGFTVINVDHIKPRRDFPELALVESNLQILCHACNHGKGNWDRTDWREQSVDMPESDAARVAEKFRM